MKRFLWIAGACSCSFFAAASCGPAPTTPPPSVDAGPPVDSGPTTTRICLPIPADYPDTWLVNRENRWQGPFLGWVGAEADAPQCKPLSSELMDDITGYTDPSVPVVCGECSCSPGIGPCSPPKFINIGLAACPPAAEQSFNGPPDWDGGCTSANAHVAGALCDGKPCVQSIVISQMEIEQTGCEVIPAPPQPPITWQKFFKACSGGVYPHSPGSPECKPGEASVVAIEGSEFKQCLVKTSPSGDLACPPEYPDQRFIYHKNPCEECTCSTLSPSRCDSTLSVFADDACAGPLVTSAAISSDTSPCIDVAPGSALGSKKMAPPVFTPATCELEGGYEHRRTLICCQL
jgi:hypothetical protein